MLPTPVPNTLSPPGASFSARAVEGNTGEGGAPSRGGFSLYAGRGVDHAIQARKPRRKKYANNVAERLRTIALLSCSPPRCPIHCPHQGPLFLQGPLKGIQEKVALRLGAVFLYMRDGVWKFTSNPGHRGPCATRAPHPPSVFWS